VVGSWYDCSCAAPDPLVSLSRFTTRIRRSKWLRILAEARTRDFPRDLVWCKLARQTTAFSTLGRGVAPAVLTNELHGMSTHRVPIQTLRPPRRTGPYDPQSPWNCSEEPIELHDVGTARVCTRRPFAMQSSLDSRQVMPTVLGS
jgi:hypothetical protein